MSDLTVRNQADDGDDTGKSGPTPRGNKQQRRAGQKPAAPPIPTADECLASLAQLARLVAIGILAPAQSNSMAASYREILRHHQRAETGQATRGMANLDVLGLAALDPEVINQLSPLLSDEQVKMLLARSQERGDEQN